ncbi:MAG: type II toxin-antitoxin system VapC family toxin [Candidatus Electrothrix sp. YB6]
MLILDTNAVIYLHNNQLAAPLAEDEYCISIITEIELLSFPGLSGEHEELLKRFFHDILIHPLDENVKQETIALKRKRKLKTPDAIICATALVNNATLLTNDRQLLNIEELNAQPLQLK